MYIFTHPPGDVLDLFHGVCVSKGDGDFELVILKHGRVGNIHNHSVQLARHHRQRVRGHTRTNTVLQFKISTFLKILILI